MSNFSITAGKIDSAIKVVVYGPEGIGKSTLASRFPGALFIDTEGSTKRLDVARLDKPTSWEMLKREIDYVKAEKPCKTLAIDTLDWAETLCIESVCKAHGKAGIEEFGYGNGYVYEKEEFGRFLNLLTEVIEAGINVVLTAHAVLKKFEQPDEAGAYDRWELKLGKRTTSLISPLIKEWADTVLFCNYETFSVAVDDKGKKHKAQGGKRVMYTSHHPCWDAKNRDGLPEKLPMDYEQIRHIVEHTPKVVTPTDTSTEIPDTSTEIPDTPTENIHTPTATSTVSGLPQALRDLMNADGISEAQIRSAVALKGYFPADMPISDYPKDFIEGVLIGAWKQVVKIIIDNDYPF